MFHSTKWDDLETGNDGELIDRAEELRRRVLILAKQNRGFGETYLGKPSLPYL